MFKLNNYYLYRNHDDQDNKRPPCYHTNDGQGTGLGKGGDNRGSRGSRHDMSRAFGMFFFFTYFYLLNVYFALRTTSMTMNSYCHHHTPSQSA